MTNPMPSFHEWFSRVLVGGALGCGILFLGDLILLCPFWKPLLKSDERWQTVFFVAKVGLPAAFVLGALAGFVWRRSHTLRLTWFRLVCCCLTVAYVSTVLRPVVAHTGTSTRSPLYEVVPDTMAGFFCVLALLIAVWHVGQRLLSWPIGADSAIPEQEDADQSATADRPRE